MSSSKRTGSEKQGIQIEAILKQSQAEISS